MTKTCSLVFLRRNDQILLAMKKRGFGSGYYNGVGGKIEQGETLEQAMVRECIEEIGVTPVQYHKVAEHDFIMDDDGASPWHMHVHAFICTEWQGEPAETDEMAPEWFKLDDIPYARMWQDDIVWLPLVLQGKQVRCTFRFNQANDMLAGRFEFVNDFV